MISDEAVRAASDAFWRDEDSDCMVSMRRALEAAAPYIEKSAYERGFQEGFDEGHLAGQESMETE